jgi:lipopolysaccharide biosynthesis protein
LPADLGFYDLRLPEVREQQAALARRYGIYGFCYYHYWFNGRRLLSRPFDEVLKSGSPDFPFCLCWANENWTRAWDGGEHQVLLAQEYSPKDDLEHIQSLIPAFRDPRYIHIDGRPVFLVYRTELLPDPAETAKIWREECKRSGVGEPYLARVEHFVTDIDPLSIGFDAAVEFAPDGNHVGRYKFRGPLPTLLAKLGLFSTAFAEHKVVRYPAMVEGMLRKPEPAFKRFHCVTPMWDNSPRRKTQARIYVDSTPERYQYWLARTVERTARRFSGDERIVFVNAWNEWAEGCHLEPDLRWGHGYLQATSAALQEAAEGSTVTPVQTETPMRPARLRRWYWALREGIAEQFDLLRALVGRF